jgi:hypothetical protein
MRRLASVVPFAGDAARVVFCKIKQAVEEEEQRSCGIGSARNAA